MNVNTRHDIIELVDPPDVRNAADPHEGTEQHFVQTPSPCDGGTAAWRILISAFIFEALLWGFPLSFGVFQNYYSRLPQFASNPYISIIGTSASGLSYIGAPVMIPLIKRYPRYRKHMIYTGWPLTLLSLLASSYASTLPLLILTQGLFYGLGFTLFYYPILSMVNDFWIQRRGFAYGILCSASGLSGCIIPFAMEAALNRWGYRITLRAAAGGLAVVTGPLLLFLRGRMESERSMSSTQPRTDWRFLNAGQFWIYSLSNLVQGLGYFFPGLYLPSYANSIGLSSRQGALLLAIMGTAQVAGQMSFGYLSDKKVSLNLLITVSTAMSSIAVLACWGMARQYAVLIVFSIVYGFFGAGYTAMWARMGTAVSSDPTAAFAAFGLLNLGKGVGNVVAGPVGGSLLGSAVDSTKFGVGKFEGVVLFAGGCMVVSGLTLGLGYMKRIPHVCKLLMEIWSKRRDF